VVGHEERIELTAFQGLREAGDMAEIEIGIRIGARVAPPRGVYTDWTHEGTQPQLSLLGHGLAPTIAAKLSA
jgi:hypothetical protein